jgi:hypothetical protein
MKALAGVALVALHAAGFVALASRTTGDELAVELRAPRSIDAVPASVPPRAVASDDGNAPGLVHRRWTARYRGGFVREVSATALAGPVQDPAAPPCSGRVVVGQRLLDDLAARMSKLIDGELRGQTFFPVGEFQRIEGFALRWTGATRDAPHGYVRAAATVVFERASVPLVVSLVPLREGDALHFQVSARAQLQFGNRVVDWVTDKVGANKLASRLARREIDDLLATTLAPPPPFELSEGQTLAFAFCDAPVEIADGAYGALPFAVVLGRVAAAPEILPPRMPAGGAPHVAAGTRLALELDLSALDAMLYELWRTGWLDRRLDDVGLDRRFNSDATVTELLSLRLSPVRLALPPVISAGPRGTLRLAADARVTIADSGRETVGRVFGAIDFTFAPPTRAVAVDLGALDVACERAPVALVPCYGELVAALRDRGSDFHGALTDAFARLLAQVFVDRRLTTPGVPVELAIRGVVPSLIGTPPVLHLELDAALATP